MEIEGRGPWLVRPTEQWESLRMYNLQTSNLLHRGLGFWEQELGIYSFCETIAQAVSDSQKLELVEHAVL